MGGKPAHIPKLKQIRYPVYSVTEVQRYERRRRLRETKAVIFPAFSEQINRTVAPFVVTNPISNTISVKFALVRHEPVSFASKTPLRIQIAAKTSKKHANRAHSAHIMQQKTAEKYEKRLGKFAKLMTLFSLAKELEDE
jgi:hypothetical protein